MDENLLGIANGSGGQSERVLPGQSIDLDQGPMDSLQWQLQVMLLIHSSGFMYAW